MRAQFSFFFAFTLFCSVANAQKVKPLFSAITDVIYETNSQNKAVIKNIVEVNSQGVVHYRSVWYNGIADTTYQLQDTTINKLNKFFNGTKPLTGYMLTDKLKPGHHFGGDLEYVSYTDTRNKTDSFILVTPFLIPALNDVLGEIDIMPSKIAYKGKAITNPPLSKQIKITESRCSYIPKIEEPPTVMELKN
nr:hypothetical protein [uncultured Mucilaginibacter sp.]